MKTLIRFAHVFLGVSLFLSIGMIAQNYDTYYDVIVSPFAAPPIEANISGIISDESDHAKTPESQNVTPHPSTTEDIEPDETHAKPEPSESTNPSEPVIEVSEEPSDLSSELSQPVFNYDMAPIDHHSVDHLHKMIEIIDSHITEDTPELKDLHNQLYTRNYMHLEKEIGQKNSTVNEYILSTLAPLTETDNTETDLLFETLDELRFVLVNLTEVE